MLLAAFSGCSDATTDPVGPVAPAAQPTVVAGTEGPTIVPGAPAAPAEVSPDMPVPADSSVGTPGTVPTQDPTGEGMGIGGQTGVAAGGAGGSAPNSGGAPGPMGGASGTMGGASGTMGGASGTAGGSPGQANGGGASEPAGGAGSGGNPEPEPSLTIEVSDVASLREALANAAAGQRILVAPGNYAPSDVLEEFYGDAVRSAYFMANASGTEAEPIVLESADPDAKAELIGLTVSNSAYGLWIRGQHWVIRNLVIREGGKGLILDEASHSLVDGVEVYEMGDEGIHLRSGTSHTIVQNCVVDGVGRTQPPFGEAIYIGSDNTQWDRYPRATDHNVIRGCTLRDFTAEGVDVKEGTTGNIIENNTMYGSSVGGIDFNDSFVDLKGDAGRVFSNVFYAEGNATVSRGVAIVFRPQGPTATNNWIFDNTFHLDDAQGLIVHAFNGADNHAWNNTRIPAGEEYDGDPPELYLIDPR